MKKVAWGLVVLFIAGTVCCQKADNTRSLPVPGGKLVVAQASGPKTFNPLFAEDSDSLTLARCLMGTLIRINNQTHAAELELAESVEWSPDHRLMTARIRSGAKFSDGQPLTADDVRFTFQVIYDPQIASPAADLLRRGDGQVTVEKVDDRTVRFVFPGPWAGADRMFSGIAILPKHVLERTYLEGKFDESVWGLATAVGQVVGLGPFRLRAYEQGQRTVLARNPYYWKRDAQGKALPYLDEIEFLIIPERSARLLRFQQGEVDLLSVLRAEEVQTLKPLVDKGEIVVKDLGPSLITEFMWFNLNPGTNPQTGKPYVDPVKLAWFSQPKFRQAVAYAIDRPAIVDVAFAGAATPLHGFVSPGEKTWYEPNVQRYSLASSQAKALLNQIGLRDRTGDGILDDAQKQPVTFTLITNAGNELRQKMGLIIQEDLKAIGIGVKFEPLETRTLLSKINSDFDYEACLLGLAGTDADPNAKMNILLSSATGHYWHPGQPSPATAWEARIDELMMAQARTVDQAERQKLFADVQRLMAEQVPLINLAARNLVVAARRRVGNLKPGLLHDFLLWNAEELFLRPVAGSQ